MMPYLINWVKSESMPYQRKRARGTGKGGEDVSMSKNLQEPLEKKIKSLLPGYLASLAPGKAMYPHWQSDGVNKKNLA